jgi:hypothetical protein
MRISYGWTGRIVSGLSLFSGAFLVLVQPVAAQTVFQDFNTPGQYTNNFNP